MRKVYMTPARVRVPGRRWRSAEGGPATAPTAAPRPFSGTHRFCSPSFSSRGEGRAVHHMVYDADDPFVTDSSPYRSKNYADLKRVLAKDAVTSAIEHLRELRQTPVATWLESFAQKFAEKHEKDSDSLQGHEIIQELLESNYVMLPSRNGKLRAIEPDKVAMLVMKHRAEHAKAWIEACSEVESDHTKINAMNLEFQYRSASEDVAAALAEQLREEHAARRMRDRENLLSGAASWWEHMEDFEVDDTSA
uniref:Uncharacterized protein n=1 Tax=Phaeomonas parva TaxID=124430 RepID=A0A7S1TWS5_9STRA|mmetsp:Transcript_20790/g.63251  ORF Transcript_20790/g.63251 Transcript_20790/m.63251 type:complete len:250 (+) Transcript_20790:88-837(+)